MSNTKFCFQCRYCMIKSASKKQRWINPNEDIYLCTHEKSKISRNYVTGEQVYQTCYRMRKTLCGFQANLYKVLFSPNPQQEHEELLIKRLVEDGDAEDR